MLVEPVGVLGDCIGALRIGERLFPELHQVLLDHCQLYLVPRHSTHQPSPLSVRLPTSLHTLKAARTRRMREPREAAPDTESRGESPCRSSADWAGSWARRAPRPKATDRSTAQDDTSCP